MEQRNQFRIISAAAVLRIGKCVVVAWEVLRIGGASIVVLDSVSECLACRNDGLAAYVTARTIAPERMGSGHQRAAVAGFHSSECVLRNEQRRALAALLRHLVSLRFAMVANERAKLFAGSAYRCRGCSYVSDEALQLAVSRSRACGDRREIRCDQFTNTSRRADRASRTDFVRCNSGRHLDALDKISFWRSHRIDSENWFARLDAKTVRRLVAASHFHAAWWLDFLVGFNRELLARGSQLAWSTVALARGRWILRGLVVGSFCRGYCRVAKTGWPFRVPTTGNWKRNFDFSGRRCVSGAALDSIRFR